MERLADDELLVVLQYLGVADLLACRLVCKRLATLALHRDAWRRQRLSREDALGRRACAVLRLAPCLAAMDVTLLAKRAAGPRHPPYATTRCAVRSLRLDVAEASAAFTALVIRNQTALGRLRHLHLVLSPYLRDTTLVLETLASADALESLLLYNNPDTAASDYLPHHMTLPLRATVPRPSLRSFQCDYEQSARLFIDWTLAAHAATLEEVDLGEYGIFEDSSPATARLLGGVRNLRKLSCPLLPDMGAAAAGGALRELVLSVRFRMGVDVALGEQLLRRARQLQKVTLDFHTDGESDHDDDGDAGDAGDAGARLILALGPSVESLVVRLGDSSSTGPAAAHPPLRALRDVLPSLARLSELELHCVDVTEDLLRLLDMRPSTAPALRRLELSGPVQWTDSVQCPHGMVHRWDTMAALMRDNPLLHVSLSEVLGSCCLDGCGEPCDLCARSCIESETSECWDVLDRIN